MKRGYPRRYSLNSTDRQVIHAKCAMFSTTATASMESQLPKWSKGSSASIRNLLRMSKQEITTAISVFISFHTDVTSIDLQHREARLIPAIYEVLRPHLPLNSIGIILPAVRIHGLHKRDSIILRLCGQFRILCQRSRRVEESGAGTVDLCAGSKYRLVDRKTCITECGGKLIGRTIDDKITIDSLSAPEYRVRGQPGNMQGGREKGYDGRIEERVVEEATLERTDRIKLVYPAVESTAG